MRNFKEGDMVIAGGKKGKIVKIKEKDNNVFPIGVYFQDGADWYNPKDLTLIHREEEERKGKMTDSKYVRNRISDLKTQRDTEGQGLILELLLDIRDLLLEERNIRVQKANDENMKANIERNQ